MYPAVLIDELLGPVDGPYGTHHPVGRRARCSACGFHVYAATRAAAFYALRWHHHHTHVKPWHHDA